MEMQKLAKFRVYPEAKPQKKKNQFFERKILSINIKHLHLENRENSLIKVTFQLMVSSSQITFVIMMLSNTRW